MSNLVDRCEIVVSIYLVANWVSCLEIITFHGQDRTDAGKRFRDRF